MKPRIQNEFVAWRLQTFECRLRQFHRNNSFYICHGVRVYPQFETSGSAEYL